jgi:hypothetical protein
MRLQVTMLVVLAGCLVATPASADEMPTPEEVVQRATAALGGGGFSELGVLKLEISEEQVRNDGTSSSNAYTMFVDSAGLSSVRMELEGDVVVARNGGTGWSTSKGEFDERPQTSRMAKTTLNQSLFPLLVPYSLVMDGVWLKEVTETTWDGQEAWAVHIPFAKGFFTSPVLTTTWRVVFDKEDFTLLGMDFLPALEFRDVQPMGVRYRYLKYDDIDGVKIPSQVLAVGINLEGYESGANRITRIGISKFGPWQPRMFLSPKQLEALEED